MEDVKLRPFNADELQELVDNHHGVYCPQTFIECYEEYFTGISKESLKDEIADIKNGDPYGEDSDIYWEAWDKILNECILTDDNGDLFKILQNQDVWALPEDMDYPDDEWYG